MQLLGKIRRMWAALTRHLRMDRNLRVQVAAMDEATKDFKKSKARFETEVAQAFNQDQMRIEPNGSKLPRV